LDNDCPVFIGEIRVGSCGQSPGEGKPCDGLLRHTPTAAHRLTPPRKQRSIVDVTFGECVTGRCGHRAGASTAARICVLALLLAGCAEGRGDGGPGDGRHLEGLRLLEARTPEAGGVVDEDQDGYCAPGTKDPQGLCTSFDDCNDRDPSVHPGAVESCANVGMDNDCDGDSSDVDEDQDGKEDVGVPCPTGLPGVCADGKRACDGTRLTCVPDVKVGQRTEECNGKDDNCDGKTDEGTSCSSGNSCAGSAGCQCGGNPGCTGGQQCCAAICVDVGASVTSCGACGVGCGVNETCDGGACRCGNTVGALGGGKACPVVCVNNACATCTPTQNIAQLATPTSSGGGPIAGYDPPEMNNGSLQASCTFHWVTAGTTPSGKWIQYCWPCAVLVGSVWFDTSPAAGSCGMSAGRTLAGGTLQHWNGSGWSTLGTISGKTDDWSYAFTPVSTTKLRLYDLVSSGAAGNPMIYEWRVFCQ
jgi:hypothetical protein